MSTVYNSMMAVARRRLNASYWTGPENVERYRAFLAQDGVLTDLEARLHAATHAHITQGVVQSPATIAIFQELLSKLEERNQAWKDLHKMETVL